MKFIIIVSLILFFPILQLNSVESNKWKKLFSLSENYYSNSACMSCADSLNCTAFLQLKGTIGYVIKTTDGGFNWQLILDTSMINNFYYIKAAQMINKDTIFISCWNGDHIITADGGLSWNRYKSTDTLYSVSFLKNGIGIGSNHFGVLYSRNNGKSWDTVPYFSPCMFVDKVFILSDSLFTCFGFDFKITKDTIDSNRINIAYFYCFCRSENRGLTWEKYIFDNRIFNYFFIDSLRGWVTCKNIYQGSMSYDLIEHTDNGGKTWTHQLDTIFPLHSQGISSISFINDSIGAAIGHWGKLVLTKDGGKNWYLDTIAPFYGDGGNTLFLNYVVFLTPKRFLVLTYFNANIYLYDEDGFPDEKVVDYNFENTKSFINPNPINVNCNLILNLSVPCQLNIEFLNYLGQRALPAITEFSDAGTYSKHIDLSGIAPGIYFIVVNTGKERYVQKVVKH